MQGCSSMPECTVRKKNVLRMLLALYLGTLIRAVEYRLRKQCCDVSEGKKIAKNRMRKCCTLQQNNIL